jgi:hypothetical protein
MCVIICFIILLVIGMFGPSLIGKIRGNSSDICGGTDTTPTKSGESVTPIRATRNMTDVEFEALILKESRGVTSAEVGGKVMLGDKAKSEYREYRRFERMVDEIKSGSFPLFPF